MVAIGIPSVLYHGLRLLVALALISLSHYSPELLDLHVRIRPSRIPPHIFIYIHLPIRDCFSVNLCIVCFVFFFLSYFRRSTVV